MQSTLDLLLQFAVPIAWIGTAGSFLFGVAKWHDQRNREQEQYEHDAFHMMICLASGKTEDGRVISMVQQVAAVYQLQSYKKYSFASIPVLELLLFETLNSKSTDQRIPHLERALTETKLRLSAEKESKNV